MNALKELNKVIGYWESYKTNPSTAKLTIDGEVLKQAAAELAAQSAQLDALKRALWKSDPWEKNSDEGFTCMHCGHDYIYMAKTELPDEHHEADCIWLLSKPAALAQPESETK